MPKSACQCAQEKPRRHKLRFERDNPTTDQLGGQATPWATPTLVTTAMAAVEPIRGGEMWKAQQIQSPTTHRITIRYRRGIVNNTDLRIRWIDRGTERIFNIQSAIDVEERHRMIEIMANENVPA